MNSNWIIKSIIYTVLIYKCMEYKISHQINIYSENVSYFGPIREAISGGPIFLSVSVVLFV